jgi:hypothetical protein
MRWYLYILGGTLLVFATASFAAEWSFTVAPNNVAPNPIVHPGECTPAEEVQGDVTAGQNDCWALYRRLREDDYAVSMRNDINSLNVELNSLKANLINDFNSQAAGNINDGALDQRLKAIEDRLAKLEALLPPPSNP